MIIWRIWPLANDPPDDPASCKWSSGGSGLLEMIIRRDQPLANDHQSPLSLLSPLPGSRFNLADLSRTFCSCCIANIFFDLPCKFQMLCIAIMYLVTSFPRKDQLPERSSAEWTDAFYRGRRSSRIQVSYFLHFRNQIWYHLCPKFAGLWRGAWNVLPFAGGAENAWQSGTYSHTRGLRISEVNQLTVKLCVYNTIHVLCLSVKTTLFTGGWRT